MSSNVAVTIRIPSEHLFLIDEYAHKIGDSRSEVLRTSIENTVEELKNIKLKEQMVKASRKVRQANLAENLALDSTLEDGLN